MIIRMRWFGAGFKLQTSMRQKIEEARQMAVKVLLHNMEGPYAGLPRTAGWGYPEPYTRDLMILDPGYCRGG